MPPELGISFLEAVEFLDGHGLGGLGMRSLQDSCLGSGKVQSRDGHPQPAGSLDEQDPPDPAGLGPHRLGILQVAVYD